MVEKLMGGEEHLGDTNTEPQAQTAALADKVIYSSYGDVEIQTGHD